MEGLATQIKKIAVKAGEKILEVYDDIESFEVETKSDNSPLTRADKLSNDVIVEGLERLDEYHPIISEENKMVDYSVRKKYRKFWLVDPLDGTKEFIKRNGEFTVNIALIEDGEPVLGVVYVPVSGELYWGEKNNGAFYEKNGEVEKLSANAFTLRDQGLRVVCSRSHINKETQDFIDKLINPGSVSRGSSLKFLIIAKGEADIYPRLGPTMEWDTAAAQIILEESGGKVVKYDSEEPLNYNKESLLNPYFVASGQLQN